MSPRRSRSVARAGSGTLTRVAGWTPPSIGWCVQRCVTANPWRKWLLWHTRTLRQAKAWVEHKFGGSYSDWLHRQCTRTWDKCLSRTQDTLIGSMIGWRSAAHVMRESESPGQLAAKAFGARGGCTAAAHAGRSRLCPGMLGAVPVIHPPRVCARHLTCCSTWKKSVHATQGHFVETRRRKVEPIALDGMLAVGIHARGQRLEHISLGHQCTCET